MSWWNGKTLGIIGLGNMGHAIAAGVADAGLLDEGCLVGFDLRADTLELHESITVVDTIAELASRSDAIIVAVKPYGVANVLTNALGDAETRLVISVAAGVELWTLSNAISRTKADKPGLVRAMPNIAASVGASCTAIVANDWTDEALLDATEELFSCVGTVVRLGDEVSMHGFTGGVGSGIAYGFVFAEALADAMVAEGLGRGTARRAAASVLRGAAELLLSDESVSPAERKDAVCSPGGTTIEGIAALERNGFRSAVISAVRAAAARSRGE